MGPGGLIRALRTIPMYVEIAEAVKRYAPDSWVINYTNPMTLCIRTLYEVFPNIKAFGCCDEVFGTQNLLVDMLNELKGNQNVKRDEIEVNIKGINHFTWIDEAMYKDMDLIPLYDEFVTKYYAEGYDKEDIDHWMNNFFSDVNQVKFDLFRNYGIIAAAGDRHLSEFMPPLYLKNPEKVKEWKFGLTPVSWRVQHKNELIEKSKRLVSGAESIELKPTGEDGVRQNKSTSWSR